MITGLNTDVRHRELVLHVQTEDKGVGNPCIESLVYVGGQILERRQRGYRQLLDDGKGKTEIAELMESQHRSLIADIRSGQLDPRLVDLGALPKSKADPARRAPPPETPEPVEPAAKPPAQEPEPPPSAPGPTLDQVILDYLNAEADEEHLLLRMDAESELEPGQEAVLRFEARSSIGDEPVEGASISVQMISPTSEPLDLGAGETDGEGRFELRVALPKLAGRTAALIVRAGSRLGIAEIKHLI